jgi:hypothetical protein
VLYIRDELSQSFEMMTEARKGQVKHEAATFRVIAQLITFIIHRRAMGSVLLFLFNITKKEVRNAIASTCEDSGALC